MNIEEYISSGIIEAYVLGELSDEESAKLEKMAVQYPEIRTQIESAEKAMEAYLQSMAVTPPEGLKENIMKTIRDMNNVVNLSSPPILNKYADSGQWESAVSEINAPDEFENIHIHTIVLDDTRLLAKAWVKKMVPEEVHNDEIESFLILEGTCRCNIGGQIFDLCPGDYLEIPPHVEHQIEITSDQPVVAILQRLAA